MAEGILNQKHSEFEATSCHSETISPRPKWKVFNLANGSNGQYPALIKILLLGCPGIKEGKAVAIVLG